MTSPTFESWNMSFEMISWFRVLNCIWTFDDRHVEIFPEMDLDFVDTRRDDFSMLQQSTLVCNYMITTLESLSQWRDLLDFTKYQDRIRCLQLWTVTIRWLPDQYLHVGKSCCATMHKQWHWQTTPDRYFNIDISTIDWQWSIKWWIYKGINTGESAMSAALYVNRHLLRSPLSAIETIAHTKVIREDAQGIGRHVRKSHAGSPQSPLSYHPYHLGSLVSCLIDTSSSGKRLARKIVLPRLAWSQELFWGGK